MTPGPDERPVEPDTGPAPEPDAAPAPDAESARQGAQAESSQDGSAPADPSRGARRPGGEPEMHPDEEGRFGPESESEGEADELAATRTALQERTLDLQRLQAEYLNYKRRVERDRELVKQNATFGVLSQLLPVLDDIDRAREHGELEGGFKAVADSLERIVANLGLTKFGAKGEEFDPNFHEALMHGHSPEVTTTTVDVVAHAGYRIGERVVRAAKVTVLDPEPGAGSNEEPESAPGSAPEPDES